MAGSLRSSLARPVQQANVPPGCWRVVPASPINGQEPSTMRLELATNGELWAVSNPDFSNPPHGRPYILHWSGVGWDPLPAIPVTSTYSVAAGKVFSTSDLWALMTYIDNGQPSATTAHWDGNAWQMVPIVLSSGEGVDFSDIDGTSSNDLWLAGTFYTGPHSSTAIGITAHWDGKEWVQHDTPPIDNYVRLNRVKALSAQDVWAVGTHVLHWDGSEWQGLSDPNVSAEYNDLTALSPDDIWAAGRNGVIGHWDGRNWTQTFIPYASSGADLDTNPVGIAAAAPNDVWAAGSYEGGALLAHWDGNSWTAIPNPVAGFRSSLTGIVAPGGGFWAVGTRVVDGSGQNTTVLLHNTGQPCQTSGPEYPLNPPVPLPGTGSAQFITGESTSGIFLKYWQEHGGLQQQGYPISGVLGEQSDLDGRLYTVQYFERAVFEYHAENQGTPFEVLLAQLGTFQYRQKYSNGAPNQRANQDPGTLFFPQTGKHLGGTFLKYWQEHGGLQQQGYPISDEFTEVSDLDGKPYTVQYFERAVFEWHPENPHPYNVLLSQLGHFRYDQKYNGSQAQTVTPRRIADSILPTTLHAGGNELVWADLRSGGQNGEVIYSYDAAQNRQLAISQPLRAPATFPLATNGALAFWTRTDVDRRYLEGYDFRTHAEARLYQPDTVSSPDFRRSDIALDRTTLYYTDYWEGHTGIFAQDLATGDERQIYDKVPALGSLVASDGMLLWTEERGSSPNTTRTLHLYRADTGSTTTVATGIGAFAGYGVSGDYVVYSFFSTITTQTTYLYNVRTGARKVVALGAASDPVIQGSRVAWVRWPSIESGESDGWKIETYDIASGATKVVASGLRAMPRSLALLADGKIAYAADNDLTVPGSELYVLDLDSSP
jgi:hypothetical protein